MRVFIILGAALLIPFIFAENDYNSHGKITELYRVDQDEIFVLINYIYINIKAKLVNPLANIRTEEGDFHINENTTVEVPFISITGMYKVAFTDEAIVVCIPLKKGDVNALFILPEEGNVSEIEASLNEETIQKWKKSMDMRYVELSLPKFSISSSINLKETLSKLGVADIFSDNTDLSGITGGANTKHSRAVRKAMFSLDEKVTDSVGSTTIPTTTIMFPPRIKFYRPFLTVIMNDNYILFPPKKLSNP